MSFTVTRLETLAEEFEGRHTWPLRMTVASTNGHRIPAEIFVYHTGQQNGAYSGDIFEAVASVHQLAELGVSPELSDQETHGVDENRRVPYYRRSELLFHCRSASEAEELYQAVMEDIRDLIRNFDAQANLAPVSTITFS